MDVLRRRSLAVRKGYLRAMLLQYFQVELLPFGKLTQACSNRNLTE
jgi:hypothetical protein